MKEVDYFAAIYEILPMIPAGFVATYGQLAYLAGFPQAPRIAGRALAYAPGGLPCHRVVNSQGRTAPHFLEQRALLEQEGVVFKENGCVNLKLHLWNPFSNESI
ncbi:MAG: MGMT family protein [Christensenellaceae bacterium]|jgi:methylated-DNA-protein-cysteine methyltransferase-like protein